MSPRAAANKNQRHGPTRLDEPAILHLQASNKPTIQRISELVHEPFWLQGTVFANFSHHRMYRSVKIDDEPVKVLHRLIGRRLQGVFGYDGLQLVAYINKAVMDEL